MKISVVIPVYNERDTIRELIKRVQEVSFEKEIIVVDDFSTDGTREILKEMRGDNLKILFHDKNKGKGATLKTGFQEVTGDIVIIQDADLEYNPQEYKILIQPILEGKADAVYGSRFLAAQNLLILMSAATFLASFGYIVGYYLLAIGKMWLATLLNLIWFLAIIAPAYHLIKYLGADGLGITYLASYILLSTIFIFYLRIYLKININKLTLHLAMGTLFPILLFVMNQRIMPIIFYFGLFIFFVILFVIMITKMIDKTLIMELFRNKLSWAYKKNDNQR